MSFINGIATANEKIVARNDEDRSDFHASGRMTGDGGAGKASAPEKMQSRSGLIPHVAPVYAKSLYCVWGRDTLGGGHGPNIHDIAICVR